MPLSEQDKTDYLQHTVLASFNLLKAQPISSSIMAIDGTILAITDQTMEQFGFNSINDTDPKVIVVASNEEVLKRTGLSAGFINDVPSICSILIKLIQIAAQEKTIVSFNSFMPRNGKFRSRLNHYLPIFHPSGEVVAVQSFSTEFRIFHVEDYLKYIPSDRQQPLTISENIYNLPITLTPRQHEILYFLINGCSHHEIAEMLQVHRGTVSKTIAEIICPKFGINDVNTNLLIKKARFMHYDRYIPPTLCIPCIISLIPHINDKYFNGKSRLYPAE